MTPAIWAINGNNPSFYGVTVAGGSFRASQASSVTLHTNHPADAAEQFTDGQSVTIDRNGAVFFTGKVRQIARRADDAAEGHDYLVEDAWADLEKTTYQEPWIYAGGYSLMLPICVLGMKPNGDLMNTAEQIAAVIDFAADSCGIAIQAGSMPAGMDLWPSEAHCLTCAEIIRNALRYHPNWIPWIDHGTTPPTLNVTERAAATTAAVDMLSCTEIHVAKRNDRIPECVRICYVCSATIDDVVYRDLVIDKWPLAGPDAGPGVLCTDIALAGGSATVAKQQVETVDIPFNGANSAAPDDVVANQAAAKAYLKWKFPKLQFVAADPAHGIAEAGVRDTAFSVIKFGKALLADANAKPVAINPNATRLQLRSDLDAPRELVQGPLPEWIRKRSGLIQLRLVVKATNTATQRETELIRQTFRDDGILPPIIGTNAETKIYKGQPEWKTAAESVPSGVARAFYESIADGCLFEGSLSLVGGSAAAYLGSVVCVSEGQPEWLDMKAPIHSISWNAKSDSVSIGFGPNPFLAIPDFLEYLRLLRRRDVTWWSAGERASAEIGSDTAPSAHNDTVTGGVLP